ncbi:MAG: (Fe-S)-binding protein [Methanosarcinaceae archaeon]
MSSNIQLCYQCGKCTAICPVRRVIKTSPRTTIYQSNVYGIDSDDIWNCLTCNLCYDECPQGVDYPEYVREKRANKHGVGTGIGAEGTTTAKIAHEGVFTILADMMANLGSSRTSLKETGNKRSKVGYYPGCLDFHDMFFNVDVDFRAIADSSMELLSDIGLDPGLLQIKCCGHDQLWQGDKTTFEKLKEQNTKLIEESGIETLVTSCAECYRTLSQDYDLPVKVVHISQLLKDANFNIGTGTDTDTDTNTNIGTGTDPDINVTYHDACRLGRHMGEYDAPRNALTNSGAKITEMKHNKKDAWCCGVSSMLNCNDRSKALRKAKLDEAKNTGADVLITTCPKCLAHLTCMKTEQESVENYEYEIMDLTVFLAGQKGGRINE